MALGRSRERGTAAVESIVATAFLITTLTAGFATLYLAFTRAWLERAGYETLMCLASDASVFSCEAKLKSQVELALPIGRVTRADTLRMQNRVSIDLRFSMAPFRSEILRIRDTRPLPLKP